MGKSGLSKGLQRFKTWIWKHSKNETERWQGKFTQK